MPDPRETLMDIVASLVELAQTARSANYDTLAYLIDAARTEAENQSHQFSKNVIPIWPPREK